MVVVHFTQFLAFLLQYKYSTTCKYAIGRTAIGDHLTLLIPASSYSDIQLQTKLLTEDCVSESQGPSAKRARLVPPASERIMVYVRQETEDVYTPLHLVPPTVHGLISGAGHSKSFETITINI